MAEADTDIADLTEEQQLALQQYTAVTDQDLAAALPLLRRCEWNIPIAISRFYDGEPAPPVDEPPVQLPAQEQRRSEILANGFPRPVSPPSRRYEAAPRVVQPESQLSRQPPFLLSLLLTPANLVYGFCSRFFGLISYFFPFLPRLISRFVSRANFQTRRPLGPQDTTARFLREFSEEYGTHSIPFQPTSYARAFDLAKRELRFLVVVPLSPEHDDTSHFVRESLLSPSVVAFLNDPSNNLVVWGGTVQDSECYQVSTALNVSTFPAVVVIAHTPSVSSTAMSVLARLQGPEQTTPQQLTARIQAAMAQHGAVLERTRANRAEQQATRTLRERQNDAYERSLAADRERARQRKEEESRKAMEEKEAQDKLAMQERYARDLDLWKRWRAKQIAPEPDTSEKDAIRISVRMLDGTRVMRRFKPETKMEEVYALVECWDVLQAAEAESEKEPFKPGDFDHAYGFRLVSPMPREVYELTADGGGSLRERIGRSGNLIVERIEQEDEDVQ